ETFVQPGKGELGDSLRTTHRHFESGCGAYAHFIVMRYLLAIARESRYGDSMERMLYNAALGIQPILEDGSTFYYSDYHPSARKSYIRIIPDAQYRWDKDDRWPCCSGTFPQVTADYGISSYLRAHDGNDGIYVNLYQSLCAFPRELEAGRHALLDPARDGLSGGQRHHSYADCPAGERLHGLSAHTGVGREGHNSLGERPPCPRGTCAGLFSGSQEMENRGQD